MEWRIVSKIAALAVALPTSAVLLYWLLIRKDDDGEEEESRTISGKGSTLSRQTTIQISVPQKAVGAVIGPKGATIKKIQEESGARANFIDHDQDQKGDEDRSVLIRGDRESVQRAELMIRQVVADLDSEESEEVYVPASCIGHIIGRGGETIRSMSRSSGCKIFIDRSQESKSKGALRTVKITGSHKDIQIAKVLIEEKVKDEENFRRKKAAKGDNAEKRREEQKEAEEREERVSSPPTQPPPPPPKVEKEERGAEGLWDAGDQCSAQVPGSEPMRESMEVFVSAVENAGRFWLQMVNGEALNLETLTESMTSFYTHPHSSEKYKLTEVKVGDVVASPFATDDSWYRARVEGFVEDKVDLFYLDFGDIGLLPLESLRELKLDFLSLPVQAVECKLANVKPTGEGWTEESSDTFEELTHCAEWVILQAKTVGYVTVGDRQRPCVQLVDNSTAPPTDVAQAMVAQGHALWEDSADTAPPGDAGAAAAAAAAVLPAALDTVRPELVPDPQPS